MALTAEKLTQMNQVARGLSKKEVEELVMSLRENTAQEPEEETHLKLVEPESEQERGVSEIQYIHKDKLLIDEAYQRSVSMARAKKIARDWEWLYVGTLIVGEEDGNLFVIDGQHRLVAARMRNDIENLPCVVHKSLPQAVAAKAFVEINTKAQKPNAKQQFQARLMAKDPIALEMNRLLIHVGYSAPVNKNNRARHSIQAVATFWKGVEKSLRNGDDHAKNAIVCGADLCDGAVFKGSLFSGLYEFSRNASRQTPKLPFEKWSARLTKRGLEKIEEDMNAYAAMARRKGNASAQDFAKGIIEAYNFGAREEHRIEWIPVSAWRVSDGRS
jgi:hypothetical protein